MNSWHYADKESFRLLNGDPMSRFVDAVPVKRSAVREVWKAGEFYFKFDKRPGHSFKKEFRNAAALEKCGIPVVSHLAWGSTDGGYCLVTRSLPDSATVEDYLADHTPDEGFWNSFVDFLKLLEYRRVIHRDLHCGNILYVEENNTFFLVDVRDASPARWYDFFCFSPYPICKLPAELAGCLSTEKVCSLLRKLNVPEPENFLEQVLEKKAKYLAKQWQRRREQILSGYPKFTRIDGDMFYCSKYTAADLERAESVPGDAGVFAASFYLDLARIPHRKIYAWDSRNNLLWAEPLTSEDADSAMVAEQRARALLFGVNSSCSDWTSDESGLVKLSVWKGM